MFSFRERLHWLHKEVWLYVSVWENDPTSLSKQFPNEFMVSTTSFKSSSIQHDVHCVNYSPIQHDIDDKAGYALGRSYLVIDKLLSFIQSMVHTDKWPKYMLFIILTNTSMSIHGCLPPGVVCVEDVPRAPLGFLPSWRLFPQAIRRSAWIEQMHPLYLCP